MFQRYAEAVRLAGIALIASLGFLATSCTSVGDTSAKREPFTFVQLCDTQLGMSGYENDLKKFRQAVKQINDLKPDFVVICGDLVGRPHKHTFDDFNAVKAKFTIPCHCVPGNHDVGNKPTPETLEYYRKSIGKDYYSFMHKGYQFVCVNSQLWKAPMAGESEAQDTWLKTTLRSAAKKGLPVFVIAHYPLYGKTPDEKENYYNLPLPKRKELLELFEQSGVVAVLTGHTHKVVINDHNGIQLVSGETTSKTHGSPLGFRLWKIKGPRPFVHTSIPLKELPTTK